jgi:CDP-glucose 4,6-dehydratase
MSTTDWSTRRVFVTGATGMVGSRLCRWLVDRGAYVTALVMDDDPQSELMRSGTVRETAVVSGRLEDRDIVERGILQHETDTVFHLGAQTLVGPAHHAPRATFEANIAGTWNLLEACRLHSHLVERVVVASSDKAYGTQPLPYTEDMPLEGRHPYEVSKSCTDLISTCYAETYGVNVAIARCGNIYGPGDLNWSRIVPGTFRSLIKGEQPVLRSDGTFLRDYIHVDDVVGSYVALADHCSSDDVRGRGFNFSNEQPLSVMDIYRACCAAAGQPDVEPLVLNKAAGEIKDQYLNASTARDRLNWTPTTTIDDGLKRTFEWYREFVLGAR